VPPPEPITPTSPRPVGRTLLTQGWQDLTFLHWAVDPDRVAPLLPRGTSPDLHEGVTYVGLVPFRMRRIGLLGAPGLPWVGSFAETNVRLYSVDGQGRRGVVFASLDAERLLPVLVARWIARLPYLWARMRIQRDGDLITYTSTRRWPGPRGAGGRIAVRVGPAAPPDDPLAQFLTGRWGLHQTTLGRTAYWPNAHPAWPLRTAELVGLEESLTAAAGIAVQGAPDSALFSDGVHVRFGPRLR
jgi:uncharacterized protein